MKKKGAELISIFLISLLIFCSFSLSVYAVDNSYWGYNDSYINDSSFEDNSLFFLPLIPQSDYDNYLIFYNPSDDSYYAYISNGYLGQYYIYGDRKIVSTNPWDLYKYKKGFSNNWEFVLHNSGANYAYWDYNYPGMQVIDATLNVNNYSTGSPIINAGYRARTGYRIYWTLALLIKHVLNLVEYFADYIMLHELLRYLIITVFAGELFVFVILILKKIGEFRSEKDY